MRRDMSFQVISQVIACMRRSRNMDRDIEHQTAELKRTTLDLEAHIKQCPPCNLKFN